VEGWTDIRVVKGEVEGGSKTPRDSSRGTKDAGRESKRILKVWTA
jgi:hypothetical protein